MSKHYEAEFRKKIVRLHLEEGRTLKGLAAEYGVSKVSISIWVKEFREECRTNNEAKSEYDYMKENLQLKKQLEELRKENDFLKKRRHSLRRKSIRGLSIYREIRTKIWCQMAIEKTEYSAKCILQLSEKQKS